MVTARTSRNGSGKNTPVGKLFAHIIGWGMAVPDNVMTNQDLAAIVETSDEWIVARTGIRERHIATERDSTATLGLKAAKNALEVANIRPSDLDLVIVATSTPENIFPSTASLIQGWLGATKAGAFDLSAACSGFVYGVDMAAQAIAAGRCKNVLVIGAETMSRIMNWNDRGTCILFGDGAGAVVLQANETEGGVLSAVLRSDGTGYDLLGVPTVGSRDTRDFEPNGIEHNLFKMHMNGGEVFKFGTRVIGESIQQVLEMAGVRLEELSLIIPHQANERIILAAARSLKVEKDIFMCNVDRYGNTSAASIPIALCEAVQQGRINEGDYIAFVGFGGGLAWASMLIKWGIPKPQERHASYLNRRQREFSYALTWWRARFQRWNRRFSNIMNRLRLRRGRISRLQRKLDQQDRLD